MGDRGCPGLLCVSAAAAAIVAAPAVAASAAAATAATVSAAGATVATAAAAAAAGAAAAAVAATAAEEDDEDQDDPKAVVAAPTRITHRQEPPIETGARLAGLSPSYAGGSGMCGPEGYSGCFPRMVRVGLQQRSSRSERLAAGSLSFPPHWAQVISTEL